MAIYHRPDVDEVADSSIDLAPRYSSTDPARLLLIDNGKAKAKELLGYLADELGRSMPIGEVEIVSKPSAGFPLEDEQVDRLAERADLVITGLGDCGACSASSLQDALLFESRGVPSTVLITEVFISNIARFADLLGSPGYHSLVVPHPAATKDSAQLRDFAASVADAAAGQLVSRDPAVV